MKTTHTPGPWFQNETQPLEIGSSYGDPDGDIVTVAFANAGENCPDGGFNESKANARLIAAAPELWAIVERLAGNKSGEVIVYNNLRAEARAAIAKAKG